MDKSLRQLVKEERARLAPEYITITGPTDSAQWRALSEERRRLNAVALPSAFRLLAQQRKAKSDAYSTSPEVLANYAERQKKLAARRRGR
jgi:hypothetical protein